MKRRHFFLLAACLLFALCCSGTALANNGKAQKGTLTNLERQLVEEGFRLMPYDHPFVLAYEKTYGVTIDSFVTEINGKTYSGVPFEFGGKGKFEDFSSRWWSTTSVRQYPVGGLDCAGYLAWIYRQAGYEIPRSSTSQFFSGQAGVLRQLPGIRPHYVIPSFEEAMIGDIAYNSQTQSYSSGHGSHVQMYLGTANRLGIAKALLELYPDFPCDAHLVLECGWSDGDYYYKQMKNLKVRGARSTLAGVGVQFFTSIRAGSEYLYQCPTEKYVWTNPETGNTFTIESRLEDQKRYLQYKPKAKVAYPMNLSRPIIRPDVKADAQPQTPPPTSKPDTEAGAGTQIIQAAKEEA